MQRKLLLQAALCAISALALPVTAMAADAAASADKEKCYGVAKAGKNDCAANGHACAGQSKQDKQASEFVFLPSGTCERLIGGSLVAKQ